MGVNKSLEDLQVKFSGDLYWDSMMRTMYATDASVYRELPTAVAIPKSKDDLKLLIDFAQSHALSLIPRAAGTSLAGQCVGSGIVVDISKHFTQILEFNAKEKWIKVQPGVIRDELNLFLKPHGLFFGPETSTANRAMIGGMVGNNSTGTNSIRYGNTRDHVLELEVFLSDGSMVKLNTKTAEELQVLNTTDSLEGRLYQFLLKELASNAVREEIIDQFPKASIHRRNTGYAIDEIVNCEPFIPKGEPLNLCKLMAGSEGTLALITEIKLNLVDLPPEEHVLLCPHFNSVQDALKAIKPIMELQPYACELMDKLIMDCTKENAEYKKYRYFLKGDPAAILMLELRAETKEALARLIDQAQQILMDETKSYECPEIFAPRIQNAWKLRKAGLGLLANIPGDKKAVAVIEDTAVHIDDLPQYIDDFTAIMETYGQKAVYYAHAGAGELHLRPILNLKESADVKLFEEIAWDTARLVKKYKGSLSGEHGDGRVRASFIPYMLGEKNYKLLQKLKANWDPNGIFNKGKITDAPNIDEDLRYEVGRTEPVLSTVLNFDDEGGILRLAEKCNGSGDCRKTHLSGGTMCPSYMATKNEKDTTRARANVLREFLTQSDDDREKWTSEEIKEALDLCLSCKACKNECPSNVDMASLKAEFSYQYQKRKGTPIRAKLFGHVQKLNQFASIFPGLANKINATPLAKKILGIAAERTPPELAKETLKKWFSRRKVKENNGKQSLYFFADEFTNYYDVEAGKACILLLEALGYNILMAPISDSGRAFLSKGMLNEAIQLASSNVKVLLPLISEDTPLIGVEPSAILSFRDEYIRLIDHKEFKDSCLVKFSLTIEEFLVKAKEAGSIQRELFVSTHQQVVLHGHCHQKALSEVSYSEKILSIPPNYHVETLPTGCCGMAGSFGYEKEHYQTSMEVGELVLFPSLRKCDDQVIVAAPGTSCRHQIFDGTRRKALHPAQVLYNALK
ncbi:MAG: FAD-binding protein [Chitinophagales bacterium]|nr:FAD-binding protein [Chitinophagales bacterium]